jgi:hypothetical protein
MHGVGEVDVYFRVSSPTQRNEYGLTLVFEVCWKISIARALNFFFGGT